MADRPKLAVVVHHPNQHLSPGCRSLHAGGALDLEVIYWTARKGGFWDPEFARDITWDVDLLSGYRYRECSGGSILSRARSLFSGLRAFDPDVLLVSGWGTTLSRLAIFWGRLRRRKVIVFGDSTVALPGHPARSLPRRVALRVLMSVVDGAFSTGTFNTDFYLQNGLDRKQIFRGVLPVDVDLYASHRNLSAGTEGRFEMGFAGKLVPWKGVDELLRAVAILDAELDWRLRIIGDGPQRVELEGLSIELGLTHRVEFLGFRNQTEMPALLAGLDILVAPSSTDRRTLIVPEAMAAGTPSVVSSGTAIWGPDDLLEHGVTGWVYPLGELDALAGILASLIRHPDQVAKVATAAVERVGDFSPESFARRLEEAVAVLAA